MDFIKRNRKKSTLQYIARITELMETNGESLKKLHHHLGEWKHLEVQNEN